MFNTSSQIKIEITICSFTLFPEQTEFFLRHAVPLFTPYYGDTVCSVSELNAVDTINSIKNQVCYIQL